MWGDLSLEGRGNPPPPVPLPVRPPATPGQILPNRLSTAGDRCYPPSQSPRHCPPPPPPPAHASPPGPLVSRAQ